MSWHVDTMSAALYAARGLDPTGAASVESHLLECDRCRATVGDHIDDVVLDSAWLGVTEVLDQPALGALERALRWAGCCDATARIVAASTRVRWAFVLAVACSLLLAVVAARTPDEHFFDLYVFIAPLGPLVATGGSFGRWSDPAHLLAATAPTSTLRILLIRVVASVLPAIALTMLSVPWVLDRGLFAIAWLLPSLALSAATLALSSWVDIERAAVAVGVAWLLAPIVLRLRLHRWHELLGMPAQLLSVLVLVTAAGMVLVRRDTFDQLEA